MRNLIQNSRSRALLLAATSFGALLAATLVIAGGAGAASVIVLGQTPSTPPPSCPATVAGDCQAVGKVTGFQVAASKKKNLFRVPANGQIVYWEIYLSKPKSTAPAGKTSETKFFNDFYGKPPKAGIAILRKRKAKKGARKGRQLKLIRESSIEDLTGPIGESGNKKWHTFALATPLRVKAKDIVALTIPTWAPAFAIDVASKNAWRASRSPKRCNGATNIKRSHAQRTVGKFRTYGCLYRSARLLYRAGFVAGS